MLASSGPGSLFGLPPIGSDENAVSAAQRAFMRVMVLGVPINTEGLIELCRLGWLDPNQLRNSAAVDAVIDTLAGSAATWARAGVARTSRVRNA